MQKKRTTAGEQYRRQLKRRRIFLLSILAIILLLCICLFTPLFGISEITVTGNTYLSSEDIINTSGIEKGENVFRFSKRKAEKALSSMIYVEGVEVKRKFLARVLIEIDEAKKDIIVDTPKEFIVSTISGRVLEKTVDVTELTAPIVYGIEVSEAEPSGQIVAKEPEKLAGAMERIGCFYETDYWEEIDEFYVGDPSNFRLVMKSGMKVTFGSGENIESLMRKIKMMTQILPQIKQTDKSYLDLTTDKGYFGEYTDDEIAEMKRLEESGGILKNETDKKLKAAAEEAEKAEEEKENNEEKTENPVEEIKKEEKKTE